MSFFPTDRFHIVDIRRNAPRPITCTCGRPAAEHAAFCQPKEQR